MKCSQMFLQVVFASKPKFSCPGTSTLRAVMFDRRWIMNRNVVPAKVCAAREVRRAFQAFPEFSFSITSYDQLGSKPREMSRSRSYLDALRIRSARFKAAGLDVEVSGPG
jgi:hypothetical protein